MTRVGDPYVIPRAADRDRAFEPGDRLAAFFTCDSCGWPSAATGGTFVGNHLTTEFNAVPPRWIPEAASGKDFPDVPDHIASAADEAHRCRSFEALRASILVCRSVIEATAKEKGIVEGQLVSKIDEMAKQGLIRPHIKEAAHEIRHLGNDMAHGDFVEQVEQEEADEILELMGEVLTEVFQSPMKIERRRLAREAKKGAGGNT
jgi:hypothetical protein